VVDDNILGALELEDLVLQTFNPRVSGAFVLVQLVPCLLQELGDVLERHKEVWGGGEKQQWRCDVAGHH
jgi:hypothetical protein